MINFVVHLTFLEPSLQICILETIMAYYLMCSARVLHIKILLTLEEKQELQWMWIK